MHALTQEQVSALNVTKDQIEKCLRSLQLQIHYMTM